MTLNKKRLKKIIKEVLNESDFVQTRPDIRSQQDQDRHDAMLDKQAARWKDELAASDKEREVKRRRRPHKYRLVVGDKDEGTYATKQETIDQLQRIWMELDGPYPAYSIIPIDPPIRR
jgi:hypothetical protein